ncbi:AraC family transcriptional regulator [Clostridium magnum]|uniref:HTH-type transcriptional activator RhaR n=1 Tax=Clostridium magnum DSM 2767 TaxID=1121326 RepID=A0A161WCZ3_9CLOT|nr:AraC family transcriptional regulator [Clostridium magnum]KZL89565.1 HTH-type transcriptional activator RhaR [Clostridium magnum DSM 2767]SHH72626.1 transcriptional regulator, AraC family [Clostridium magnum DSM 2767]
MYDENSELKIKRGYLNGDFEFFHLVDKKSMEFEFHYHDFNKIIVFISGKVTYLIEGKSYRLKPWDLLFINSNDVHRAIVSSDEPYERIVIWVNQNFLELHNNGSNLLTCFELSSKHKINLLRSNLEGIRSIKNTIYLLEDAIKDKNFGNIVLKNSLFLQLMVYFNRLYIGTEINIEEKDIEYDERIVKILDYINKNLGEILSVENIALKFYMNKFYLMHKFKAQTGYTLHSYIQQKRLVLAASLVKKGKQITEIYLECGFRDYSSFVRAFKKEFNLSPKKYYKSVMEIQSSYIHKHHT